MTPTQCIGKYITYARSLDVRYDDNDDDDDDDDEIAYFTVR